MGTVGVRSPVEKPAPSQTAVVSKEHQTWNQHTNDDDDWGSLEAETPRDDFAHRKSAYLEKNETSSWDWNSSERDEADEAFFDSFLHTDSSKSGAKSSKELSSMHQKQAVSSHHSDPTNSSKLSDWESGDFFKQVSLNDNPTAPRGLENRKQKTSARMVKKHSSPPRKPEKIDDSGWGDW